MSDSVKRLREVDGVDDDVWISFQQSGYCLDELDECCGGRSSALKRELIGELIPGGGYLSDG